MTTNSSGTARSKWLAGIALGIAIVSIALTSIWLAIAERELTPVAVNLDRLSLAAIVLFIWQLVSRLWRQESDLAQPTWSRRTIGLMFLAGASFSTSLVLLGWSLLHTSIAVGTLLYNSIPIFTAAIAWLVLGRTYNLRFVLGTSVAIAGIAAIGYGDLQAAEVDIAGDAAALFAAILAAIALLCFEELRKQLSSQEMIMWVSAIGGGLLLPWLLVRGEALWPHDALGWTAVVGLALFSQAIGQGLLTFSLAVFSAGSVAVCMLLVPVVAAVLSALIFAERLDVQTWLKFAVILAGIYLAVSARESQNADARDRPLEEGKPCPEN